MTGWLLGVAQRRPLDRDGSFDGLWMVVNGQRDGPVEPGKQRREAGLLRVVDAPLIHCGTRG